MRKYKQMTEKERETLYLLRKRGASINDIGRIMSRHKSTVSRELRRNVDDELGYLPNRAHRKARKRKTTHSKKLDKYPAIREYVVNKLKEGWSPVVIAGRMNALQLFPFVVTHETIYQLVYSTEGNQLGLHKFLLRGRPKRQMRFVRKKRKELIPDRISIHQRPEQINTREEFGHYEGDLTFCKERSANIGVIVERKSRLVRLIKNDSKKACQVMKGMFNVLAHLPQSMLKSVTFDNGLEFVKHGALKKFLKMKTFFCDPHSPWQKGQVENTNAMIHRFIKKKDSLANYSETDIHKVENWLNNLPRKCLEFKTANEVFYQGVALRT